MTGTGGGRYGLRVALAAGASLAWGAIALGAGGVMLPALCVPAASWSKATGSLNLALALNPPATLAAGWALMIAAMMPPLLLEPLRHIGDRSFARRRARAMMLFAAGYGAAWMAAGVVLQPLVLASRLAVPDSLLPLGLAIALALVWQVSPAKQFYLNRCHRRPHLAAFGAAADRDAFCYGLTNGLSCIGACWALMVLPLLMTGAHIFGMIAVALFVVAERLETPAELRWRWRGAGKALRLMLAQARMRSAPATVLGGAAHEA